MLPTEVITGGSERLTALLWCDAEGRVGSVKKHPFRANAALCQARTLVGVRVEVMVRAGLGSAA